jgi:hypothetical protein
MAVLHKSYSTVASSQGWAIVLLCSDDVNRSASGGDILSCVILQDTHRTHTVSDVVCRMCGEVKA